MSCGRDPADRGPVLDRMLAEPLEQLVVAVGVGAAPLLVGQPGVDDGAHHPERERAVGARQRPQVLVGDARGAAAVGVDDAQPRAVAPRLLELQPQVRSRRHRVPAPDEQVARVRPLLRIDLRREPLRRDRAGDAGAGADRPHELARADRVHEAVGDRAALQRALGPHVAVGQHRLGAVLVDRRPQPGRRRRRAPRPSSRAGTRPRPSRRCGSAGEAGGPRRRRGRGSWTPSRTGSPR